MMQKIIGSFNDDYLAKLFDTVATCNFSFCTNVTQLQQNQEYKMNFQKYKIHWKYLTHHFYFKWQIITSL